VYGTCVKSEETDVHKRQHLFHYIYVYIYIYIYKQDLKVSDNCCQLNDIYWYEPVKGITSGDI